MALINKQALLDAMPSIKDDIGFQTALLIKLCDQMPTNYLSVVLSKLFYTRVWDKPYYILRKGVNVELYFGSIDEIRQYFKDELYPEIISDVLFSRFVSGLSKIKDYTLEKKGESL